MSILDRLDALPAHRRGRVFEELVKWWLTADPRYRDVRRAWLWSEWPGRWGADAGIDLVAETRVGELWAIQAKAYAPAYAVKKADVDSFLTESNRSQFSFRVLVATTDRLGPNAERAILGQEKPVGIVRRSALERSAVRWPRSLTRLEAPPRKRRRPRPHQRRAISDVTTGLRTTDRGQLIMACGTGKTLAALWIAEQLEATRTLVLVPSLSLLEQTLREWLAEASEPFPYLAVCSDETVAPERDEPFPYTADLGVPVTTDAGRVRDFLRRRGRRVIFSTYQSSPVIAEAQATAHVPRLDLVIADEAHRCAGPSSSAFAAVLDADRIRASRRLFMTATPRYFTGRLRREAREAELELASMDDQTAFGPVLHRLTFGDAIRRDLLSDYRILVTAVDHPLYARMVAKAELVRGEGLDDTDAGTLARQVTLLRAIRRYHLRRVLTFHSRVRGARRFAQELQTVAAWVPKNYRPPGRLWASYVSGAMNVADRSARLDYFRHIDDDERAVLANARCLAEGVDVPAIDGVAFIDPRRSQIDVIQAVGRAIRRSPDKTLGTIVVPVLVSPEEDPETVLEGSEFARVWEVVRALRAHDEDLAEELDEARRRLGRERIAGKRPHKLILDIPIEMGHDFPRAFDARLVDATTASWEWWYGLLEQYAAREGHASVPNGHVECDRKLGVWVSEQRTHRAKLSPYRKRRLEALPGWSWEPRDARWEKGFAALEEFVRRKGHARVPRGHLEGGLRVGDWVAVQRTNRAKLSPDRKRRLEALPGWIWNAREAKWEQGFAALQEFVRRNGDARVPHGRLEGDVKLGSWVSSQRMHRATMAPDRKRRLDALPGWTWDALEDWWEQGFAALEAFVRRNGHVRVPQEYLDEGGFRLRQWVTVQRTNRAKLSPDRKRRLEALPGWSWEPRNARWETGFAALEEFVRRNGDARVAFGRLEGDVKLGVWVSGQRKNRAKLSPDRKRRLEALPGWTWDVREAKWETGFAALQEFVRRNGDARVPHGRLEGDVKLGVWVSGQRTNRAKLSPDRKRRLEALPGWTWDVREAKWETGFAALQEFVRRKGHARVPRGHLEGGLRVGNWVAVQRTNRAKLSPDRKRRLEALPGWIWNAREAR